jgi:hypothetical protein
MKRRGWALAAWAFGCIASAHAQNETTAALASEVRGAEGRPLAGAEVLLRHEPTGIAQRALTNSHGRFAFSGLPVGGPCLLVVSAAGHQSRRVPALQLALGENTLPALTLTPRFSDDTQSAARPTVEGKDAVQLAPMIITARRERASPGASTTLERDQLDDRPTIDRSLNEYARTDPHVALIDAENGELTAAGQNGRYNATQIDGVRLDDIFGLESNGQPSQGNPFSLETLETVTVEIAPYDAGRSGFTGASINAVTKRGANTPHGSLYYAYRNQNFRARHPFTGERDPFVDQTGGITLGGPLMCDRLFFFVGYEHSLRTEPAPTAGFDPDPAALARLVSVARSYGYEPGALASPGDQEKQDHKYLARLDWHLTPDHRLSARYSETRGHRPVFVDYDGNDEVSLSNHWYRNRQNLRAWSLQAFDRWRDTFQTELKLAHHRYDSGREAGVPFPPSPREQRARGRWRRRRHGRNRDRQFCAGQRARHGKFPVRHARHVAARPPPRDARRRGRAQRFRKHVSGKRLRRVQLCEHRRFRFGRSE